MNKATERLARAILKNGHVELKSKVKKDAASSLDSLGLIRFYEKGDAVWVKTNGRVGMDALEAMLE